MDIKPIFATAPQQMSYESMWNNLSTPPAQSASAATQRASGIAKKIVFHQEAFVDADLQPITCSSTKSQAAGLLPGNSQQRVD